jgi:hypothetical protein
LLVFFYSSYFVAGWKLEGQGILRFGDFDHANNYAEWVVTQEKIKLRIIYQIKSS